MRTSGCWRGCGLPAADGVIPWAGVAVAQAAATRRARLGPRHPCHWQVGQDHVAMGHRTTCSSKPRVAGAAGGHAAVFRGDAHRARVRLAHPLAGRAARCPDARHASLGRVVGRAVDN